MLNEIMTVTDRFADPSDTLKFALYSASYKPFLSLFHMLNVTQYHPELEGIGASTLTLTSIQRSLLSIGSELCGSTLP